MSRLEHPLYRCEACKSIITALEIIAIWEEAEKRNAENPLGPTAQVALCPCGSGRISPTNLNDEERERHLHPDKLKELLAGREDHTTKVWRQALRTIHEGGGVEVTEEERQAALTYWGEESIFFHGTEIKWDKEES